MRMTHLRRYLALGATALSLAACADGPGAPEAQTVPYDPAIRGEVEQQLAQSAARSANALETLAMIERAKTPPAAPALDESGLPPELRRKTTVEFTGPAVEVVRQLAANVGYGFSESGNPPAVPGLVTVNEHDVSVAAALQDVGLQAQKFATVIVDPNAKHVEFRHETVGGETPLAAHRAVPVHVSVRRHHPAHRVAPQVEATCHCTPAAAR